ncbi:MAG: ABC transporter ATP-binding protein [Candidatus Magasanikbacteria bacterium]|nr:ABC transporter ATP-binding protein [Candidatus Magasanikbacteria bacterium]
MENASEKRSEPNGTVLIRVDDLEKKYLNEGLVTHVLEHVSFMIKAGEFVAIMGPSGSGKSTLMHILGLLDRPSGGVYEFDGRDVTGLSDENLAHTRNEKIGFVFQSFYLLPRTSVLENVMLPLIYSKVPVSEHRARAENALKSVGLEHRMQYGSNQISGGEKQRVAIARALVNKPSVIFADEPTGNLDSKSGAQVMSIFRALNEQGHTIILVTHEKYTAEHAARIIKIHDGHIVSDEKVSEEERRAAQSGILK